MLQSKFHFGKNMTKLTRLDKLHKVQLVKNKALSIFYAMQCCIWLTVWPNYGNTVKPLSTTSSFWDPRPLLKSGNFKQVIIVRFKVWLLLYLLIYFTYTFQHTFVVQPRGTSVFLKQLYYVNGRSKKYVTFFQHFLTPPPVWDFLNN